MDRLEYKYLVPFEKLSRLRQKLSPFVELDNYAKNKSGEYTVHSIYFDTLFLDYYYQKIEGIQHRKKIRIRGYNKQRGNSPVFLEIKRKNNMTVSKNRAPILFKNVSNLFTSGDIEKYVMNQKQAADVFEDARRFFYHIYRHSLRPIILVRYEREAFFRKVNDSVRITFDKNLRSSPYPALLDLFGENSTLFSLPGHFILEIKFFDGIPLWFETILEDFNLEQTTVSKYTICLDTHRIPCQSSIQSPLAFSRSYFFKTRE